MDLSDLDRHVVHGSLGPYELGTGLAQPFLHTTAMSPSAFHWDGQPPKSILPFGGSGPHVIHGSFHSSQSHSSIPIPVHRFLHSSAVGLASISF